MDWPLIPWKACHSLALGEFWWFWLWERLRDVFRGLGSTPYSSLTLLVSCSSKAWLLPWRRHRCYWIIYYFLHILSFPQRQWHDGWLMSSETLAPCLVQLLHSGATRQWNPIKFLFMYIYLTGKSKGRCHAKRSTKWYIICLCPVILRNLNLVLHVVGDPNFCSIVCQDSFS